MDNAFRYPWQFELGRVRLRQTSTHLVGSDNGIGFNVSSSMNRLEVEDCGNLPHNGAVRSRTRRCRPEVVTGHVDFLLAWAIFGPYRLQRHVQFFKRETPKLVGVR